MTKYDKTFHPINLVELMKQGRLDVQIYAEWDICKDTFYTWINEHEEFKEAHNRGMAKCESWYIDKAQQAMNDKDDKGFKYYISLMNNKFGWEKGSKGDGNTTNITVGTMNVLQQKSRVDLLDYIETTLSKHKDIIDVQCTEYKND